MSEALGREYQGALSTTIWEPRRSLCVSANQRQTYAPIMKGALTKGGSRRISEGMCPSFFARTVALLRGLTCAAAMHKNGTRPAAGDIHVPEI